MLKLINRLEEGLMALFLAVMTFLTATQVVLRYVFNSGWVWSLEATTYSFAWLVLLGMAYGVRTRSHIAVDLVMARLKGRVRRAATFCTLIICIVYATLMCYGGLVFVSRLYDLGNEARDLPVARWILTIMLPLGFALLALRFLELAWLFAKGRINRLGFGEHESPDLSPGSDSSDKEPEK